MLKFKSRIDRIFFPKSGIIKNDEWGIVGFETDSDVLEVIEGEVKLNSFGSLSIVGNFPSLDYYKTYTVIAKEGKNHKNEFQYELLFIFEEFNFNEEKDKRTFLGRILSESQVNLLYDHFDDPFELIKNRDTEELTKVKGIGFSTVQKMYSKYDKAIDYSYAYVSLDELGLTTNMIKKLTDSYGSPNTLVDKIKDNPYIISDDVDGIGWKKADAIAQKRGIESDNPFRVEAYIKYYLKETSNKGHSYVDPSVFAEDICNELAIERPLLVSVIRDMFDRDILYWTEDKTFIALKSMYNLESVVTDHVVRILNQENIFEYTGYELMLGELEKQQGWDFTNEQKAGVKTILDNNFVVLTGLSGCVDNETEYFNGKEWRRISEYTHGEMVLQFNPDNRTASLTAPEKYHKYKEDVMYFLNNKGGSVNQVLSLDHDFAYETSKGHFTKKSVKDLIEIHNSSKGGFTGGIYNAFNYEGGAGIDLSDEWIRVMVAVFADGSYSYNLGEKAPTYNKCRFHIKKDRKKIRLRELFTSAKIEWVEKESAAEGYTDFFIFTPYRAKTFPIDWYNATKHQLEVIADEVLNWDGTFGAKGRRSFSTTIKSDADFIQFVFSSLGYTSNIHTYDRRGEFRGKYERKTIEYSVQISKNKWRSSSLIGGGNTPKASITEYRGHDGYKYCFTVETGYLVLRRDNKIFVTGNCGKSTLLKAVTTILKNGGYSFRMCALAGKASARMEEVTGFKAETIHRMLGYNPKLNAFIHNEYNPMEEDVIIMDEVSMVGGELFYQAIRAVKNGAKLILVGDDGQLESIGTLNVFFDLLNSPYIPKVRLTEIHRQAQNSAIVTESIKIRNGYQILERGFVGKEIRGVLQDLIIDAYDEKEMVAVSIMRHYKEEYDRLKDVNKLQVIVPMRENGDASVYNLNIALQEYVNPRLTTGEYVEVGGGKKKPYKIKVGDKVVNKKNNYKTISSDFTTTPIFNGNFGIVKNIDLTDDFMEIDFDVQGKVYVPKSHWSYIELGYASTVHSQQGSQVEVAIVGIDYSSYVMLVRELPYTAITRAQKKCYLIVQTSALSYAINNSQVPNKRTFLPNLIQERLTNG